MTLYYWQSLDRARFSLSRVLLCAGSGSCRSIAFSLPIYSYANFYACCLRRGPSLPHFHSLSHIFISSGMIMISKSDECLLEVEVKPQLASLTFSVEKVPIFSWEDVIIAIVIILFMKINDSAEVKWCVAFAVGWRKYDLCACKLRLLQSEWKIKQYILSQFISFFIMDMNYVM